METQLYGKWEEYRSHLLEQLPKEAHGLPIISSLEEMDTALMARPTLDDGIKPLFCGQVFDLDIVPSQWKKKLRSFANITVNMIRQEFGYALVPDVNWVRGVYKHELKFMLECEQHNDLVLFVVSDDTLERGWLTDHVYHGHQDTPWGVVSEVKTHVGYTAWEIKYLLPMFPSIVRIVPINWISELHYETYGFGL